MEKGFKVFKRIILFLQKFTNRFESIWIHILKDMNYFRKTEKKKYKKNRKRPPGPKLAERPARGPSQIGRASCRERVCQYV